MAPKSELTLAPAGVLVEPQIAVSLSGKWGMVSCITNIVRGYMGAAGPGESRVQNFTW